MQSILIIVHAAPYGSERMLSALRLATALTGQDHETIDLRVFLMSDAVSVGLPGQVTADSGAALQVMLEELVSRGIDICLCRTCALARGLGDRELISGLKIATLPELADWTLSADKVITF